MDKIKDSFGSFEDCKKELGQAAKNQFGTGYAWLVKDGDKLKAINTDDADNPITQGMTPLLNIDVWEHAYYLQYENKRTDYIKAFWNVIDWEEVGRRYQMAKEGHYYMP